MLLSPIPNFHIRSKLKSKGNIIEVLGYSHMGNLMNQFNSLSKSDDLFSFLIENNLNKYLFGVLMRNGSLDVYDMPFREELLDPKIIEEYVNESFIKKFDCKHCKHLLLRKHVYEIEDHINKEYHCPKCDRKYLVEYKDLSDDYNVTKNDLVKYLGRLNDIDIVEKKLIYKCNKCGEYEDYDYNNNIQCKCGHLREIIFKYFFKNKFLIKSLKDKDGFWFEWYVFKICEHIFDYADHNIELSYDNSGEPDECELDVVSIKDDELFIFECKDYLKGRFNLNQLEGMPKLSKLFEKVCLISSTKKFTAKNQKYIKSICDNEVGFIAGTSLEEQFLSVDKVLDMFYDSNFRAVSLYQKLNENKKNKIVQIIISKIIKSDCKDITNLNSLSLLIERSNESEKIINSQEEDIKTILNSCVTNIYNNILVGASINFIANLLKASNSFILDNVELNTIFEMGINHISYIRSFLEFYWLFNKIDIDTSTINRDIANKFLKSLIPNLSYYGNYSRSSTLQIIQKLWDLSDENFKHILISTIKNILFNKHEVGYLNKIMLVDFLVKNYPDFNTLNKRHVNHVFKSYINLSPSEIPSHYIYNEVKIALQTLP